MSEPSMFHAFSSGCEVVSRGCYDEELEKTFRSAFSPQQVSDDRHFETLPFSRGDGF